MKQGIQTFMAEAGESACYALDIIQIATEETGKAIDPVAALYIGVNAGMLHYGGKGDPNNFFVKDPALFLFTLTGMDWKVAKETAGYIDRPGERVVDLWERVVNGKVIGHFRMPSWDSLDDSQTVKYGKIASKRVFRKS